MNDRSIESMKGLIEGLLKKLLNGYHGFDGSLGGEFVGKAESLPELFQFFQCLGEVLLLSHVFVVVDGLEAQHDFVVHVMLEGKHVSVDQLQQMVQVASFLSALGELPQDFFLLSGHICLEERVSSGQFAFSFQLSPDHAGIILPVVKFLDFFWDLHAYGSSIALFEELGNLLMRHVVLGNLPVGLCWQNSNLRWLGCIGSDVFCVIASNLLSCIL